MNNASSPDDSRFPEVSVDPGCSTTVAVYPESGCQPVWFRVPAALADDFVFTDVRVDHRSQLWSAGAVPASLFSDASPGDELLLDRVEFREPLEISATNTSGRNSPLACRPIFGEPGDRLARYRRALLVGLGFTIVPPGGTARIVVQPQRELVPDRLHVPPSVLDEVVVRNLEVRTWRQGEGAGDYLSRVRPERLYACLRGDGWFPDLWRLLALVDVLRVGEPGQRRRAAALLRGLVLGEG